MGRIPEETIQTIRDRVDVADLIGRYVGLKKAGRSYKGLCPFHNEKTPSFVVSPDRGTFHCFGCGEGGNAFAFLMRHENLTFPEAVRSLAAELGVEVPETGGGERGAIEQIVRACDVAQAFYRRSLMAPEAEGAREYLKGRGFDRGLAERFEIGFAPDGWSALATELEREGVSAEHAVQAGLLRERTRGGQYDLLRGRVTFPIRDARGRVVAFGGRLLEGATPSGPDADKQPKYLNTPESPIFRKREAFYGFPAALEPMRRNDRAVVSEGYFDRIALARAGVEETVATCGTSLTEEHARNLRRRTRSVVLLFDGDEAGQKAMLRALEVLLPHGLRVSAVQLPEGQDPDDVLSADGPEALIEMVDGARPALDLAIRRAVASGCSTPWERADAVAAVVPLLALVPDPVERGEFARRLALSAGAEPSDVEAALRRERRELLGHSADPDDAEPVPPPRRLEPSERHYATVLRALCDHPQLANDFSHERIGECAPDSLWAELARAVLARCAGVERVDVAALADELSADARRRLTQLAAEPAGLLEDAERASQAVTEILTGLMRRSARARAHATTRRLANDETDADSFLREKQAEIERRRTSTGVSSP